MSSPADSRQMMNSTAGRVPRVAGQGTGIDYDAFLPRHVPTIASTIAFMARGEARN